MNKFNHRSSYIIASNFLITLQRLTILENKGTTYRYLMSCDIVGMTQRKGEYIKHERYE